MTAEAEPRSNDLLDLVPRVDPPGRALEFDFPSFAIGVAEYDEGPTGCTVFDFPAGAACSVDVRGGSPGVLGGQYEWVHLICLAGGSLYGLEAASGAAAELLARRGYRTGWLDIPIVTAAIIFDYGRRQNAVYPDKQLGRAALRAARPGRFPLGARGAGRSATVGKAIELSYGEPAGQGAAYRRVGGTRIAVFTVVNAVGAIVDRDGAVVRGNLDPALGRREPYLAALERRVGDGTDVRAAPPGNTTLTVVVTNRRLAAQRELRQLGRQVHASMARAIQPFHALADGDVLFAVSTGEVDDEAVDSVALASLASELAWDAVLSCFDPAEPT